jgi:hypothetical protein
LSLIGKSRALRVQVHRRAADKKRKQMAKDFTIHGHILTCIPTLFKWKGCGHKKSACLTLPTIKERSD